MTTKNDGATYATVKLRYSAQTDGLPQVYNMFHRVNMHEMLMDSAMGEGEGIPATLKVNHKCVAIDHESGVVTFGNGVKAQHALIVGADGIGVSRP